MTKADLIEEVSRLAELTRKDSEIIVETIFDSVVRSLRSGDKIEIRGFGSFRTRQRKPRVGRNPKTGARVEVPAKKIPYFKPSKELKDVINHGKPWKRLRRAGCRRPEFVIAQPGLAVASHHSQGADGCRRDELYFLNFRNHSPIPPLTAPRMPNSGNKVEVAGRRLPPWASFDCWFWLICGVVALLEVAS